MIYDDLTNRVTADYEALLFALRGLYLAQVAPGAAVTPASISNLTREAHRLANAFVQRAEHDMLSYASEVGSDASRVGYALDALKVTLAQNIKTLTRQIAAGQTGIASMLKGASGGMGQLVQQKVGGIDFKASDSLGRRFNAQTLVKTLIRQFAVQSAVDVVVQEAERLGSPWIFVKTPDGLARKVKVREFEAERARIFHPNTHAEAFVVHV
jgi:hypothetical protein